MAIVVNASDALRLMAELQAKHTLFVNEIQTITARSGRKIARAAADGAHSSAFPHLAGSIEAKVKNTPNGCEVTIEAKDKFGALQEFGSPTRAPRPFMMPALEGEVDSWESFLSTALDRVM